jgi:hypothetical protein
MNCRSPWIAALLLASTAAQAEPRVDASEIYAGLIEDHAIELASPDDLAPLYEAIGKRRFVLLGEASMARTSTTPGATASPANWSNTRISISLRWKATGRPFAASTTTSLTALTTTTG